ncbi:MAG TPA: prephenate dehydratase domain-containing protein, partial [Candidatus Nanoarchaeia archaeon]|nr:prephenate dehydratase domain-containing protein [Candidatus Nanoarchaeia archaeon]
CSEFLRTEYPKCVLEPVASTSYAANKVSSESLLDSLVVCSEFAAKTYGLKVVSSNLSSFNETRFLIVGNELTMPTGFDKSMIAFGLIDKPGALYDSLKVFKDYDINLSRIESRPTKKKLGDYLFYVDFTGHVLDELVIKALNELKALTSFVKVLGSYPKNLNKSFNLGDINGL